MRKMAQPVGISHLYPHKNVEEDGKGSFTPHYDGLDIAQGEEKVHLGERYELGTLYKTILIVIEFVVGDAQELGDSMPFPLTTSL